MSHVMDRREASESSRPYVRLGKYRNLSALSGNNFLFGINLFARASESAHTGIVPSEISESARRMIIGVLYRGILMFINISFYRKVVYFFILVNIAERMHESPCLGVTRLPTGAHPLPLPYAKDRECPRLRKKDQSRSSDHHFLAQEQFPEYPCQLVLWPLHHPCRDRKS